MDYYASDVALRNSKESGFWIIIEEGIYDVTNFLETHPGGSVILINCSGRDASTEFKSVLHHSDPRIEELLKKFYVGRLIAVCFSSNLLQDLYRQWHELLHLVLEMENTFRSDLSFLRKTCTHDENPQGINPYKIDLLLETHSRFVNGYLSLIIDKLEKIKALATNSLSQLHTDVPIVLCTGIDLFSVDNSISLIRENNANLRRNVSSKQAECWDMEMQAYRVLVEREDTDLLAVIKLEIISTIKVFESRTVEAGVEILMPFYSRIDVAFTEYLGRIETGSRKIDELCKAEERVENNSDYKSVTRGDEVMP